jgi:hypothetical protein
MSITLSNWSGAAYNEYPSSAYGAGYSSLNATFQNGQSGSFAASYSYSGDVTYSSNSLGYSISVPTSFESGASSGVALVCGSFCSEYSCSLQY